VASVASAPPPPAPPNPIDLRRLQIPGGRRQRAPGGGPPSGARVFALSPIRKDPSPEISSGPVVAVGLLEFDGDKRALDDLRMVRR